MIFVITSGVKIEKYGRKYEYQANYSEAIKTCRDFLRIHDEKSTMDVEGLIASNIEAVRPGRTRIPSVFLSVQRIRKYWPFSMTWAKLL